MSRFVNVDLVPGCIHAIPVLVRESQCMWVWLATGYELSVTLNKFELLDQAIVTAAGREAAWVALGEADRAAVAEAAWAVLGEAAWVAVGDLEAAWLAVGEAAWVVRGSVAARGSWVISEE